MKRSLTVLLILAIVGSLLAVVAPARKAYAEQLCFTVSGGSLYRTVSCDDPAWFFHELSRQMLGHDLQDNKCYGMPVEVVNIVETDINGAECQEWKAKAAQTEQTPSKCIRFNGDVSEFDSYAFPADKFSETPCDDQAKENYNISQFNNGVCYVLANGDSYRALPCTNLLVVLANAPQNYELREEDNGSVNGGASQNCPGSGSFLGLPTWYEYLPIGPNCSVDLDLTGNPNQIWLIALAIADIILTVAGVIAVCFVIYGGFQYIMSQGEPDGTKRAKDTVLNAVIGLVIAILSTAVVNFVGNTLK